MLNGEAHRNIETIKAAADEVWGRDIEFGEIGVIASPYPEFELPARLYGTFNLRLEYDRSTLGIMLETAQGYVGLSRLTGEQVFRGLKSCKPENLLHNFRVLDRVVRDM